MLDYTFTEEQEKFRKIIRDFAYNELAPKASYFDKNAEFPYEQLEKMVQLKKKLGYGKENPLDLISLGIGVEEVGRIDFNCTLLFLYAFGALRYFFKDAPEDIKQKYPDFFYSGEQIVGLCMTEPKSGGSDIASLATTAIPDGDDYIINGAKTSITNMTAADMFYFFAKTPVKEDLWGITGFLIEAEAPGLSMKVYDDLGNRGNPRGTLTFNNVRVPKENIIGQLHRGLTSILSYLNINKAFIGLMSLGAAQQSLDETIEYVKKREAYNLPIAMFEGVSFPIVEAATLIEAARLLCYKVLWLEEKGLSNAKEGAMVKWWVPKLCADIIWDCIVLHGHIGYSTELPLERRFRDVLGWQIGDATPQIQKLIVAREIFGKEYDFTRLTRRIKRENTKK